MSERHGLLNRLVAVETLFARLAGQSACPFCNYSGPSPLVAEYDDTIVLEPLNPVTDGHLLIVPKAHVADAAENPRVTASVYYDAAREAARLGTPFNLITSAGKAATQTVGHLHVHLIPRRFGDGLALPWAAGGSAGEERG